jgi:hypothetical protein
MVMNLDADFPIHSICENEKATLEVVRAELLTRGPS